MIVIKNNNMTGQTLNFASDKNVDFSLLMNNNQKRKFKIHYILDKGTEIKPFCNKTKNK